MVETVLDIESAKKSRAALSSQAELWIAAQLTGENGYTNGRGNVENVLRILAAEKAGRPEMIVGGRAMTNEEAEGLATALRKITVNAEESDGEPVIDKAAYKAIKEALVRIFSAYSVTVKTDDIIAPLRMEAVTQAEVNAVVSQYVLNVRAEYKKTKDGSRQYTGGLRWKTSVYSRNTKAGLVWFTASLRRQLGELILAHFVRELNKIAEKAAKAETAKAAEKAQIDKPQTATKAKAGKSAKAEKSAK